MYLIDTNVWLERLLGQARSEEVGGLLSRITSDARRTIASATSWNGSVVLEPQKALASMRELPAPAADGPSGSLSPSKCCCPARGRVTVSA